MHLLYLLTACPSPPPEPYPPNASLPPSSHTGTTDTTDTTDATGHTGEPPYDPWAAGLIGDADRGADRYIARCAACHGEGGRGGLGPDLAARVPALADLELFAIITEGRGGMPAIGFDDDQEAVDVIAWLRDRFGGP